MAELDSQLAAVESAARLQEECTALVEDAERKGEAVIALANAHEELDERAARQQAQWGAFSRDAEARQHAAEEALERAKSRLAAVPLPAGRGAEGAGEASAARALASERLATAQRRERELGLRLRQAEGRREEVEARLEAIAQREGAAERAAGETEAELQRVRGKGVRVRSELQQLSAQGLLYTGTPCTADQQQLARDAAAGRFEELENEVSA